MIWINGPIRLGDTPQLKTSAKGTTYCKTFGFLQTADQGVMTSLVCFGETLANELARYRKGDQILIAGELVRQVYDKNGESKESFSITAKSISGTKRQSAIQEEIKPQKRTPEQSKNLHVDYSPAEAARGTKPAKAVNAYQHLAPEPKKPDPDGFDDDLPF